MLEEQWGSIGPVLDALTAQTGVPRTAPDEAAAMPGISTIAVSLALRDTAQRTALIAEPAALTSLTSTLTHLTYAQARVLPMPLDVLAGLNRALRAVSAAASALSVSGDLLAALRTRSRWAALVAADGESARRVARHLALTGIAAFAPGTALVDGLTAGPSALSSPWLHVEQDGEEYELLVSAPGIEKDAMSVARSTDDLIVTVDGIAHPIALPSGLRRCDVVGGTVRDDGIRVRFRPKEGVWRE
ncbi:ArsA family ATPase [Cumulibacter soli]|uniref:ArsA family ATPase n=1 Tax=Cumulibacter soli TaxID=2546344 RepID=UPI001068AC00|nr:hypothetical protein [Cumulibacter soli]